MKNIKVLMYHRVIERQSVIDTGQHYLFADDFRWQMEQVAHYGFTPITFRDYRMYLDGEMKLPEKPVIITFDDGYLDTYEIALPILKELGMSAVIFVLGNRTLEKAEWDQSVTPGDCLLMDNTQLQQARKSGFEIGAHSMNHVALASQSSGQLTYEIAESKKSIEAVLGEEILSISYPYGSIDERVVKNTASNGFRFGCGVYTGPAAFGKDPFDIRRLAIKDTTGKTGFLMRLLLPYEYFEWGYFQLRSFQNYGKQWFDYTKKQIKRDHAST